MDSTAAAALLPLLIILILFAAPASAATHPADLAVLQDLRKSLTNPDALGWPDNADPCGPPAWPHVSCDHTGRVDNLDLKNAALAGALPTSISSLASLQSLSLQGNRLSGPLPSFRGMSTLRRAFLNDNDFDAIPADFFDGLTDLLEISLGNNPRLNASTGGWALPPGLADSAQQLQTLALDNCSLSGALPPFLGTINTLQNLTLSYNNLSGPIPAALNGSAIQRLWLNNQLGEAKLSGTLDVIATMTNLQELWLHGNDFTGPIPNGIAACKDLYTVRLNSNQLQGLVPPGLATLPQLQELKLDNNNLLGPVPLVKAPNFTFSGNGFCTPKPGGTCAPEVMALLQFLADVHYPEKLVNSWSGNNPCTPWIGVTCVQGNIITALNLPGFDLNGTISQSLVNVTTLLDVMLGGNHLTGRVPDSLTRLASLQKLDLSMNDLSGPLPTFRPSVKVNVSGNLNFNSTAAAPDAQPNDSPPTPATPNGAPGSHGSNVAAIPGNGKKTSSAVLLGTTIPVAVSVVALISVGAVFFCKKRASTPPQTASVVVHPRDSSDPDNLAKIVVATNDGSSGTSQGNAHSGSSSLTGDVHMIEAGRFVIAVQVLRGATKNFAKDNVLGRGGFGVVYKGELHDGTMIAVKRMESVAVSNKALDEFQAEIAVLTKVRHRNLVSILGYAIEGNERLLVYEYMPNGALSRHLFQWKQIGLEPLSWKKRLNIALDVARGMEYLHNLGHHRFIHRDLKSANILLGDDFRAKVSDFGLMKDAPDGNFSVATRLAGTFGYLAPEYAVTGKISTKADVFSFGVVLLELITGTTAIDDSRVGEGEETRHLAYWFCQIRKDEEKLRAAIDPTLDVTDNEIFESISVIAELAGHCTAREPSQRPDMGHAVNVLVPMVEKWKPVKDEAEDYLGIDLHLPLLQMVKSWQDAEASMTDGSILSLEDSKGSIPARPAGFAESFTSADGR
ncbi:Receptor-like kinase TMK3 [Dichanthelium oligosanthes]|uniref:Receptor-like kinase TMK3 n=1 Tax=Dichanthelium oligosanthes TaxID=888268 RepID=A0A1E5VMU2_9POAL|nr:Receptor-like kinase TMK3 [Dichanthelium oligosanthes]